jgi:NAD(P)H-hydrate epimerase
MLKNKAITNLFPTRQPNTHKGDYGKVLIIAGSSGMLGAGVLCSRAALRAGAGLVYLAVPEKLKDIANLATPEVIVVGVNQVNDLINNAKNTDAIAIGPGLGEQRTFAKEIILKLSRLKYPGQVVLDADGLNAFVGELSHLSHLGLKLILTPHPGEMAKLLNKSIAQIQQNRKVYTSTLAKKLSATVILKGFQTVVADHQGKVYINKTGNPGMATAGMGDILTGLIAGLSAQAFSEWNAATAGVYLHGLAGDLAAKDKGQYGMIASDVVENIPYVIQKNS